MMRTPQLAVFSLAVATAIGVTAAAQTPAPSPSTTQTFPLTDTQGLAAKGVTVEAAEFMGRKAVRLVKPEQGEGFAALADTDFRMGRSKRTSRSS